MKFPAIFVLCLIFCVAYMGNAAITCGTVDAKAAPCLKFAQGKDPAPAAGCCSGLQQLASTVRSVDDKKAICRCLKAGVKIIPGIQDKYLSKIPAACKINVGFPVSLNTNCETIH